MSGSRIARLNGDRLAGAALVVVALVIAWESRRYPLGRLGNPGPGFAPLALAVLMALLGGIVALRGRAVPALVAMGWSEAGRAAIILLACGFAALALERLGYRLTIFALLVVLLGLVERRPLVVVVILAAALSLGSYFLFADLLKVPLPLEPWRS